MSTVSTNYFKNHDCVTGVKPFLQSGGHHKIAHDQQIKTRL